MTNVYPVERARIIRKIARRAQSMELYPPLDFMSLTMDLQAADCEVALDLDRLLTANDLLFLHDIGGIAEHMDRTTGKLLDCFLPRMTLRDRPEDLPALPTWLSLCAMSDPDPHAS